MSRSLHAALLLAAILTPLGSTMIAVALPAIAADLGVASVLLDRWLVMTYLVVAIAGQAPAGRLADRIGHERALVVGVGLNAIGALAGTVGSGLAELAAARMILAAGGAITVPAAMALLRNRLPVERRARAFGALGGTLGLAAAVGPLAGAALVGSFGWRAIFACNLPIVVIAGTLAARQAWLAPDATRSESSSRRIDLRFLARSEFAAGSLIVALQNLAMYGCLFLLPVVLSGTASRVRPEHLLFAMLGGMSIASPLGGRIAERLGARATLLVAGSASVCGIALLHGIGPGASPSTAFAGVAFLGAGLGLSSAPAQASAMSAASAEQAGSAAGALSTMRYLGGLAGIALPASTFPAALVAATLLGLALPGRPAKIGGVRLPVPSRG